MSHRPVFATFLKSSRNLMSGVFYHSLIHGLGFFFCFMIQRKRGKKKKLTHTFSMDSKLYAVVFAQSEQFIYIIFIISIYIHINIHVYLQNLKYTSCWYLKVSPFKPIQYCCRNVTSSKRSVMKRNNTQ